MATDPKRHHQVPMFYLGRFASGGKVLVRRRDGKHYETNPLNVAVESGYYDVPDGTGGVSKEVEKGLAGVEGMADAALSQIDRTLRLPDPADPVNATLTLFIGLQMARTTEHRERVLFPQRVVVWLNGREATPGLVAEYLETQHLGFRPADGEVDGAYILVREAVTNEPRTLTEEFAVEMMLRSAIELSRRVLALNWTLELARQGEFITSDSPVVIWRKPSRRDEYQGIGIETAEELRLPLDPRKQLVLSRRRRSRSVMEVEPHRVSHSNEDMADACHRFIIGTPANPGSLTSQRLDRWRPTIRFNVGPLLDEGATLGRAARGEVVHVWTPRSARVGLPKARRQPASSRSTRR